MEKDEQLEREFDAYFDGVAPPDNATYSAKKLIEKKARTKRTVRRFIPAFAAVAAACGIVVLAVNVRGLFLSNSSAPPNPNDDGFTLYTTDALTKSTLDAYSADLPKGLDIIKKLEFAKNAAVYDFCAYADDNGSVSLVRADVSAMINGYRHDTTVYVEYTPERTVYEPLKSFYNGNPLGTTDTTLVSQLYNNGERLFRILVYENGVRYYFSVESADAMAYRYYLLLI